VSDEADPLSQPLDFTVRNADVQRWSGLLEDDNPLHQGQADVVNPGPANLAYLISFLQRRLPAARLVSIKCRFLSVVHAPAIAQARGRIIRTEPHESGCRVYCELELLVGGATAAAAEAVLERPGEENAGP
jgi:hypothetical protein